MPVVVSRIARRHGTNSTLPSICVRRSNSWTISSRAPGAAGSPAIAYGGNSVVTTRTGAAAAAYTDSASGRRQQKQARCTVQFGMMVLVRCCRRYDTTLPESKNYSAPYLPAESKVRVKFPMLCLTPIVRYMYNVWSIQSSETRFK
ncbi:hypothetical protein LP419_35635 [Massilia sp. H-1]|nr:hypothetical protein LP419_35635 [Massilia sp. H-1]